MGSLAVFVSHRRLVPGVVQAARVTDQQVIGLHSIPLRDRLPPSPYLHQGHGRQPCAHYGGGRRRGLACMPWELLRMREQVEADLPLDDGVDQSPDDRQQREGS
jgi:hypothetical protein